MTPSGFSARTIYAIAVFSSCLVLGADAARAASSVEPLEKSAATATLDITVTGLRNAKGRVAIAVFNTKAAFPEQERALRGQVVGIKNKRARASFPRLKLGTYAVAVLHDENKNDKMDFNFLGMPTEGYGFSNDASAMFGPPSFEAASFKLKRGGGHESIKTRYFSL